MHRTPRCDLLKSSPTCTFARESTCLCRPHVFYMSTFPTLSCPSAYERLMSLIVFFHLHVYFLTTAWKAVFYIYYHTSLIIGRRNRARALATTWGNRKFVGKVETRLERARALVVKELSFLLYRAHRAKALQAWTSSVRCETLGSGGWDSRATSF